MPCPTIAAIKGPAKGGGAEVAVACVPRIKAEDADIGFVHIRLGLITAWGGGPRLLRMVGYSTGIELMTTGRLLSAREALSLRPTDRVAPMGQAVLAVRDLAGQAAENPPPAARAAKFVLRVSLGADEGMAMEARAM